MNKCKDCKHWNIIFGKGKVQKCLKLSHDPLILGRNAHVIVNMEGIYDEYGWEGQEEYETGENFGCIHFNEK